jgi:serine phosphatase RsbU (regulator of sigma subunit)/CheY-like chemotaxis protein
MSTTNPHLGQVALVVDDNETTRYLFRRWLRGAGFDILEASSGGEALAIIAGTTPDIAVLDVNLPDMSGYDVCEAVKHHSPSVPVLHVSATATDIASRSAGLRRGADAYLVEPIEREELLATVEALLRYATATRTAQRLATQFAALHTGLVDVHAAATTDALATAAARAAARVLDRRLAVVAFAQDRGSICVAAPDGFTDCGPHRPGTLLESAGPDFVPGTTAVEIQTLPAFRPTNATEARLGWVSGRTAQLFAIRTRRGQGLSALLIEGEVADESDRLMAKHVVRSVAIAVDNLRNLQVERDVALTLQRALLPDHSFQIAGVDIATRYVPSDAHAEVGGDFYEAFALDDGRVALAIGDVVGHSLEAASVMGDLRTALRAYAVDGMEPAAVMSRINRLFMRFAPQMTATMCYVILDPSTLQLVIVNAGHLPPLIATQAGAWWLEGGSTLLGVEGRAPEATVVDLPARATLVLATDGLLERRNRSLSDGLAVLADAARASRATDVDATCHLILERCGRDAPTHADDIAIMVVAPHGEGRTGEPFVAYGGQVRVEPAG